MPPKHCLWIFSIEYGLFLSNLLQKWNIFIESGPFKKCTYVKAMPKYSQNPKAKITGIMELWVLYESIKSKTIINLLFFLTIGGITPIFRQ